MRYSSYLFPLTIAESHSEFNKDIVVREKFGKRELYVNGIQETGRYVNSLFQRGLAYLSTLHIGSVKTILVLGVGGGGILFLLRKKYPEAQITAVDVDEVIIQLGKKYFAFDSIDHCSFVIVDARRFLNEKRQHNRYDLVIVDLYIGNDVPEFVTGNLFLTGLKKLLRPNGSLIMNYFSYSDQPHKAEILLDKLSKIYQSVVKQKNLRNIFFFCS